jgi:hypothetical protein
LIIAVKMGRCKMKKILLAIVIVLASVSLVIGGTATWTGKEIPVTASTGFTTKCEYAEGIIKFWRLTNGPCEQTVKTTNGGEIPKIGTTRSKVKGTKPITPLY